MRMTQMFNKNEGEIKFEEVNSKKKKWRNVTFNRKNEVEWVSEREDMEKRKKRVSMIVPWN